MRPIMKGGEQTVLRSDIWDFDDVWTRKPIKDDAPARGDEIGMEIVRI